MALFALDHELRFPPPHLAEPDGLLAMGGDLSTERLLLAYRQGIFPWYSEEPILWWSPSPRFILFPDELKINKTTQQLIRRNAFDFTINKDFPSVIRHCSRVPRPGQDGTWITREMEAAYNRLHKEGHAHSAEAWQDGQLVGGLYGLRIGNVFFGESMFSLVSNASRFAFTKYVTQLKSEGVTLIDCQVHTDYLESMGAVLVEGREFSKLLAEGVGR